MSWPEKIIKWSFCCLFIAVPLVFLPYTSELFELNKIVITYFLTSIIVTTWIMHMLYEKRVIFRHTSLDIPILLFLISQFISYIFSIDHHVSIFGYYGRFNGGLLSLFTYSFLYWAFVTYIDTKSSLLFTKLLLASVVITSLYAILQHFGIDARFWVQDVQNRVFATLGQPNWLATFIVALIFIPISFTLETKNPRQTEIHSCIALILFLALLFTKSRSGFLAFGFSSLVYWILVFLKTKTKPLLNISIFLIICGLLTFAFPNPIRDLVIKNPVPQTQSNSPALESGGTESGIIRQIVWKGALNTWVASTKNFFIGTGPETFASSYYLYRPIEHNNTSEWEFLYNKAHNEFLNYLSTTGILGLFTYLLILLFSSLVFLRLIFSSTKTANYIHLYIALFSGWLSISVMNFWGFSVVANQILLFLLPAIAFTTATDVKMIPHKNILLTKIQMGTLIGISLISLLLNYSLLKFWLADHNYATSQAYLQSFTTTQDPQNIVSAYQFASESFKFNPTEPNIELQMAESSAYLALFTSDTDATFSAQLTALASDLTQSALNTSPNHPPFYKTKARIFILLSTLDQKYLEAADDALSTASKLAPTDPRIPLNRAIIAKYQKNYPQALLFLQSVQKLKPDTPGLQKQLDDIASISAQIKLTK